MKWLSFFDHIIILDKNGTIIEQGPFQSLKSPQEHLSSFLLVPSATDVQQDKPKDASIPAMLKTKQADSGRQSGDSTIYKYFFKSTGWLNAIFAFGMSIINAFCVVFSSTYHSKGY